MPLKNQLAVGLLLPLGVRPRRIKYSVSRGMVVKSLYLLEIECDRWRWLFRFENLENVF